jgi:hypothetical protein
VKGNGEIAMTEQEWLACTDPIPMLEFLTGKASDRKLGLFACACWYRYKTLTASKAGWAATQAAERNAEKLQGCTEKELNSARREAEAALRFVAGRSIIARRKERAVQACLLRDLIVPFYFRTIPIDLSNLAWNDSTLPKLAQAIYDNRSFQDLPILADALEEGSCATADLLTHCRQPGEHVRGCWVVDLMLRKE